MECLECQSMKARVQESVEAQPSWYSLRDTFLWIVSPSKETLVPVFISTANGPRWRQILRCDTTACLLQYEISSDQQSINTRSPRTPH
jgi:hypothetical protein